MAPSTSSFLDLKAQISKQEAEFAQSRALGKEMVIKGGVQRPDKKPTVWARQNKGVASRNARDFEWAQTSKPTLEAAKDVLERKAKQYEKLRRGKTAGLTEEQYSSLLVDFDQKAEYNDSESSEDVDESLTVPQRPVEDDDPVVEYVDDFGRTRTARRSEVPRAYLQEQDAQEGTTEDDPYVIYGDANHFPTYEPSEEKIAAVKAAAKEDANPETHYDATQEVRARAAGFYQFSRDEEARRKQMEELKRSREETEKARDDSGASAGMEVRPGLEKRKRDIEERRKALEAKRRKTKDNDGGANKNVIGKALQGNAESTQKDLKQELSRSADEFLAALEKDIMAERNRAA